MKKLLLSPLILLSLVIGCSQQSNPVNASDSRIAYQLGMTLSEAQSLAAVNETQAIQTARAVLGSQDKNVSARLAGVDGFLAWDVSLAQSRAFVDASSTSLVSLEASTIFGLEDDKSSADSGLEEDELHGVISNLNESSKTFTLSLSAGTYTVDYAQAIVEGIMADGVSVEAEGNLTGTTLLATEVEVEEPEFKGTVSNLDEHAKTFTLTTTTEALTIDYGQAKVEGILANGTVVEVKGKLSGTSLSASEVNLEDETDDDDFTAPESTINI